VLAKQSGIERWNKGDIPLHLLEDKQLKDKVTALFSLVCILFLVLTSHLQNIHVPHFRLTTPDGSMKLIEGDHDSTFLILFVTII
jgi:hypothetical protein